MLASGAFAPTCVCRKAKGKYPYKTSESLDDRRSLRHGPVFSFLALDPSAHMSSVSGRRTESWEDVSVREAWKDLGKLVLGQIGMSACSEV